MKNLLIFIIFASIILLVSVFSHADTFIVTHTNDSGSGSLREALVLANSHSGADTIVFNIPETDAGYNLSPGAWTIQPDSALPELTDEGTLIDGSTQRAFIGIDTNPDGPEIELDGSQADSSSGLVVLSSYNRIHQLIINNFFKFGIFLTYDEAHDNIISGCYVGTDVTGSEEKGNGFSGIIIYNGAKRNLVGGLNPADHNICSGNGWSGVEIQANGADSNIVHGNYIGTDRSGSIKIENKYHGVYIWSGARYNLIGGIENGAGNLISGNIRCGVLITGPDSDFNVIKNNIIGMNKDVAEAIPNERNGICIGGDFNVIGGIHSNEYNIISGNSHAGIILGEGEGNSISGNFIGTDVSGVNAFGNHSGGIVCEYISQNTTIGPNNVIRFNEENGVLIDGTGSLQNKITQNSISGNEKLGIENINGGNTELEPPVIITYSTTGLSGTALPNTTVELFSDSANQGHIYEGFAEADAFGNWSWPHVITGPNAAATATDADGNTSEFSDSLIVTTVDKIQSESLATRFYLSQNYPNPFNPATTIHFNVGESCDVLLNIYDVTGQKVCTLVNKHFAAGAYRVVFDMARLPSGVYIYTIKMGSFVAANKMIRLQ